jgi:hypothetical protein
MMVAMARWSSVSDLRQQDHCLGTLDIKTIQEFGDGKQAGSTMW